ncbi:MAG: hypothetical protein IPK76_18710 [Lewinellaceae bacterium]|nr:hypothetical protein [Lewinellaceae bacterium]
MKIKVENNIINLFNMEDLKKYQISQMYFYGYTQKGDYLEKQADNIENELLKVTQYLDEESVAYELLGESSDLIDKYFQKQNALAAIFSKAKNIKESDFIDDELLILKNL